MDQGKKKQENKKKEEDIIMPLRLYSLGFTLNGGGDEEQAAIDNALDRLLEILKEQNNK